MFYILLKFKKRLMEKLIAEHLIITIKSICEKDIYDTLWYILFIKKISCHYISLKCTLVVYNYKW